MNSQIEITDINPKTLSVSIVIIKNIEENDGFARHRAAFIPGEIDKVKEFLGVDTSPEIDFLNSLWTDEVIAKYQKLLEANFSDV